jgi:hypothetical protein
MLTSRRRFLCHAWSPGEDPEEGVLLVQRNRQRRHSRPGTTNCLLLLVVTFENGSEGVQCNSSSSK